MSRRAMDRRSQTREYQEEPPRAPLFPGMNDKGSETSYGTQLPAPALWGDINVYSVARAFHEAYGVRSVCYGKFATGPAYGSTIIDYRVCPDNEDAATFRKNVARWPGSFRTRPSWSSAAGTAM